MPSPAWDSLPIVRASVQLALKLRPGFGIHSATPFQKECRAGGTPPPHLQHCPEAVDNPRRFVESLRGCGNVLPATVDNAGSEVRRTILIVEG